MRALMVVATLVLGLVSSNIALASGAKNEAIQQVIGSQLEAFKRDDGAAAFSFASPNIQRIFRNPENFMAMVRQGYAPVYRPAEVEFRDVEQLGNALVQRVFIRGADGEAVIASYSMIQMPDGSWRISGCEIEKLPELAA